MPPISLGFFGWFSHSYSSRDSVSEKGAQSPTDANTLTTNGGESPAVRAKREAVVVSSSESPNHSTGPGGNPLADDDDDPYDDDQDSTQTINDVASLKQGVIKTSKKQANAPYTILLIGETGVGKSSALELIANVLAGNDTGHYNLDILDRTNEQDGPNNQSKTNSARMYELTSKNGVVVRILDTPGLADTRGLQQDELHKQSIAAQIKEHVNSINSILVLANGTVPRVTVGTDYALSMLSTISPKSFASNIAFMFTNVLSPLHWNFSGDTIPASLQDAPHFVLNNPIPLYKKYHRFKDDPTVKKERPDLRKAVKAGEESALETLVDLFDWLDGLDPQPMPKIDTLYERSRAIDAKTTNILAQIDRAARIQAEIVEQKTKLQKTSADMGAPFNNAASAPEWKQQPTSRLHYLCTAPNCYSACHSSPFLAPIRRLFRLRCGECTHRHLSHSHTRHEWVKVADPQTSAGEGEKKRQEDEEKTEALIATSEGELGALNHAMGKDMDDLARLTEEYTALALSESFSSHVKKAIRLLEERYTDMATKGGSQRQLENIQDSLHLMKRKLGLLVKAEEKAEKRLGL